MSEALGFNHLKCLFLLSKVQASSLLYASKFEVCICSNSALLCPGTVEVPWFVPHKKYKAEERKGLVTACSCPQGEQKGSTDPDPCTLVTATGPEGMAQICFRGGSGWITGKGPSPEGGGHGPRWRSSRNILDNALKYRVGILIGAVRSQEMKETHKER